MSFDEQIEAFDASFIASYLDNFLHFLAQDAGIHLIQMKRATMGADKTDWLSILHDFSHRSHHTSTDGIAHNILFPLLDSFYH